MSMSFKYSTTKNEEFDYIKRKYITKYLKGAIHKVTANTKEECNRLLKDLFKYIDNKETGFIQEGLGEAFYDSLKNKWVGESYIFLNQKSDYFYYKEIYEGFKKLYK